MAGHPVPWTRAERTREIGYAAAMYEVREAARDLREGLHSGTAPAFIAGLPPEAAWLMGTLTAHEVIAQIIRYTGDAYVLHADPRMFSARVGSLAAGWYGTAPAEPGGGPR